jgi:hypothetical protein
VKGKNMSKQKHETERSNTGTAEISPDELVAMIANRAYFKAAERDFQGGSAEHDWLEAEKEIGGMLKSRGTGKRKSRRRRRNH